MTTREQLSNPSTNETLRFAVQEQRRKGTLIVALTDIDGTVNDETQPEDKRLSTIEAGVQAVDLLQNCGIPVGLITGRSSGEALIYQRHLKTNGPIVAEDGGVIILPQALKDPNQILKDAHKLIRQNGVDILILSSKDVHSISNFITKTLEEAQKIDPSAFMQLISTITSPAELIQKTIGHSSIEAAQASMERFASAYIAQASPQHLKLMSERAPKQGIRMFGTPLHLIGADADKGHALRIIASHPDLFFPNDSNNNRPVERIMPIAFGNNTNDLKLMEIIKELGGIGVLVGKPGGGFFVPENSIPSHVIKMQQPYGFGIKASIDEVVARLV